MDPESSSGSFSVQHDSPKSFPSALQKVQHSTKCFLVPRYLPMPSKTKFHRNVYNKIQKDMGSVFTIGRDISKSTKPNAK